jgi:hypothetical protein
MVHLACVVLHRMKKFRMRPLIRGVVVALVVR